MEHLRKDYSTTKVKSHIIFYKKSKKNIVASVNRK